jgi:predicted metal-dependent peptidase
MNPKMWKTCESNFNLERHLMVFLQESAFYTVISRHLRKVPSEDLPTAAVTFDAKADELRLYYNPKFFDSLTNLQVKNVLIHEFNHITFGHLAARRREPGSTWNIATDLAINSMIVTNGAKRRESDASDGAPLPKGCLIPGERPFIPPEQIAKMSPEHLASINEMADMIEKFPHGQASEWYFNKVVELAQKQKAAGKPQCAACPGDDPGEIEVVFGSMDDHDGWDSIPDEMREYIEGKIRAVMEKAVAAADSKSDGWGNIPAEMQAEIRRSISKVVNWRTVLRQFIGTMVRGERATSIKRINRRYPYIHPGVKRGYTARLLIAIDQSGSVDDEQLNSFFSELHSLTRRVTVDILPFDCYADIKDLFEWKKGTNPNLKRVRGGGTDFNAPTRIVNDVKNRGRWDGMLIMTDGECCAPEASRVKRGWVLSKNHKLMFDTDEIQIFVDDSKPITGAWR